MIVVRRCSVKELESNTNFPALVTEYKEEAKIAELPDPDQTLSSYRLLDNMPIFACYGAFKDDLLIGFVAVLTPIIPHYGVALAVTESLFVQKQYRNTGAGLKLLREAELHAKRCYAPGLLVSAPAQGQLAKVLPKMGFRETNKVFFRGFTNE